MKIKRLSALILALILIIGIIDIKNVRANVQNNITGLLIRNTSTSTAYSVSLAWDPLVLSAVRDSDSAVLDPGAIHVPSAANGGGYRIWLRNATAMTAFEYAAPPVTNNADLTNVSLNLPNLSAASIYAFKVEPYHTHTYQRGQAANTETKEAPVSPTYPLLEALFMTDISVSASGYGNKMTVTWDNPTYLGKTVFTGYRIYYEKGGMGVQPNGFSSSVDVTIAQCTTVPDPARPGINKLSYVITDDTFQQGTTYAIKVEPLIGTTGSEIRRLPLEMRKVIINNREYPIDFRAFDVKEYRTNNASISLSLNVEDAGKDYLNLVWGMINPASGTVKAIDIRTSDSADGLRVVNNQIPGGTLIASLENVYAGSINNFRVVRPVKPPKVTYYRILVILDDNSVIPSEIAVYNPFVVDVTPITPFIYAAKKDTSNISVKTIDLYWNAFVRLPVTEFEEAAANNGVYLDADVLYDLYVTDEADSIDRADLPATFSNVLGTNLTKAKTPANDDGYTYNLTQYTHYENGLYTRADIHVNKTYFVKIVAKKLVDMGSTVVYRYAEPAYLAFTIGPEGDISTPPVIGKPPLKIVAAATNSLTLQWANDWYEVYDPDTEMWYSKAALRGSQLIFGELNISLTDKLIDFALAADEDAARALFAGYPNANSLFFRKVEMNNLAKNENNYTDKSDTRFQYKVVAYTGVDDLKALLDTTAAGYQSGWIQTVVAVDKTMQMDITGLTENTSYVVLMRAYRVVNGVSLYGDPAFVFGTTLPITSPIDVDPVIPYLEGFGSTESSATLFWERTSGLTYELAMSDKFLTDPGTGKKYTWEEIQKNARIVKGSTLGKTGDAANRDYYVVTIDGLFPSKDYYFWLRSQTNVNNKPKTSKYSGSVLLRTKDLPAPNRPDALSLAGEDNVKDYNDNNSANYRNLETDAIIIEWLRAVDDTVSGLTGGSEVKGGAGIAAKPEFLASSRLNTYMVRFSGLTVNTTYFFRAQTILTVTMDSGGTVKKTYHYRVQISKDMSFTDYVEFIVPSGLPTKAGENFIQKESEFTDIIAITTRMSNDEYDGNISPDTVPLPTTDYEITYDRLTQQLAFRFRSDKTDSAGNRDNMVDQRFISKLINDKVFIYEVDLSSFGRETIKNRKLSLPYSIYKAFEERKITLVVKADNLTLTFAPGALNTKEVNSLPDFGRNATVTLTISENASSLPGLSNGYYLSTPQLIDLSVGTNSRTVKITDTLKKTGVELKLSSRSATITSNVGAYTTVGTMNWERQAAVYDKVSGSMLFDTTRMGGFSVVSSTAPTATTGSQSDSIYTINSAMRFTDMTTYNPDSKLSAMQLNKVMAAIARNSLEVAVNEPITDEESQSLSKAGLFITGSTVSREEAYDRLIKLYELKTKKQISNYGSASVGDLSNASASLRTSLQKAAKIGMISDNARPKDLMLFSEFLDAVAIIIEDTKLR